MKNQAGETGQSQLLWQCFRETQPPKFSVQPQVYTVFYAEWLINVPILLVLAGSIALVRPIEEAGPVLVGCLWRNACQMIISQHAVLQRLMSCVLRGCKHCPTELEKRSLSQSQLS